MEPLTSILQSFRLESSIFSKAKLSRPWSVRTDATPVGIFHAVVTGTCTFLSDSASEPITLSAGDIVFLPTGDGHIICDSLSTLPVPVQLLTAPAQGNDVASLVVEGDGDTTTLLCGSFAWDQSQLHPLASLIPQLLHVSPSREQEAWISNLLAWLWEEVQAPTAGTEAVLTRMADVLFIYALRSYIAELDRGEGGWLRGLTDPQISAAMCLMHETPHDRWTAGSIASEVGMSRSSFFERFSDLVGMAPGQYLLQWRMHLAVKALQDGSQPVSRVAHNVGYGSEASFSKAFKRLVGVPPGEYRRNYKALSRR